MISRILIVDDDRVSRAILKDALLELIKNCVVDLADSAVEGQRATSTKEYDLVIANLRVPRTSGLEFLKQLRNEQPGVQAILIGGGESASETLALNITYLTRPFNLDTFFSAVRDALGRSRKAAAGGDRTWLIECVAEGLLHLYKVDAPPVPIEDMIHSPYNSFADLSEPIGRSGDKWDAYHQRAAWARAIYWRILRSNEEFARLAEVFQVRGEKKEADYFVRSLLMPMRWVTGQEKSSVESLAHQFQVPPHIVEHRLRELSLSRPLLNYFL
jgi:CheY-like chemotaxis protein